jgi:hypothetical protein
MAKTKNSMDEIPLSEATKAMNYLRSFGGRDSIQDYLSPLRSFLADFGTLERFDYVLEQTALAMGVEPFIKKEETTAPVVAEPAEATVESN